MEGQLQHEGESSRRQNTFEERAIGYAITNKLRGMNLEDLFDLTPGDTVRLSFNVPRNWVPHIVEASIRKCPQFQQLVDAAKRKECEISELIIDTDIHEPNSLVTTIFGRGQHLTPGF
jgi:hypothetical protein